MYTTCVTVHVHNINVLLTIPTLDATTMFSPLNQRGMTTITTSQLQLSTLTRKMMQLKMIELSNTAVSVSRLILCMSNIQEI